MSHITTSPYSNEKTYTKEPLSTFAHFLKTCFCHVRAIILFQFKRKYISISLSPSLSFSLSLSFLFQYFFLTIPPSICLLCVCTFFSHFLILSFSLFTLNPFSVQIFYFFLFFFFRQYVLLISIQRILFHSENFSQNWPVCLFLTVELLFSFYIIFVFTTIHISTSLRSPIQFPHLKYLSALVK